MENILSNVYVDALIIYLKGFAALMFLLIPYLLFVILNALIARQKGRSIFLIALFSIILTPLLPYLYLLAVPTLRADNKSLKNINLSNFPRRRRFPIILILLFALAAVFIAYKATMLGYFDAVWRYL
jgi:hypothetical protein